jgi:hypothetical protein
MPSLTAGAFLEVPALCYSNVIKVFISEDMQY